MHERRMAGRTGRAVARPGRVARSHVPRVLLAAVALLVVLLQVDTAYALPWQEKDGYPLGEILMNENVGANRGTAVYGAANEFFATLCLIGRKSDYLQLSNDQLAELSNEGTGGAFYELSQRWSNYGSDGEPGNWPVGITLAIIGQGLVSDPAYIWYADYSYYETESLYNRALADYLTIYNGGHLGGGGTAGEGWSNPMVTNINLGYVSVDNSYGPPYVDHGHYPVPPVRFTLSDSAFNSYRNHYGGYYDRMYYVTTWNGSWQSNNGSSYLFFTNDVITPTISDGHVSFTLSGKYTTIVNGLKEVVRKSSYGGYADGEFYVNQSNFYTNSTSVSNRTFTFDYTQTKPESIYTYSSAVCIYDATNSAPVLPPNHWPDPPSNPVVDPPDVPGPDPYGPDVDPPDPYMPIVDPPSNPDPVTDPYVVVVAPDTQDIIPWLRAILQAINNLGDKLNAESTELQNALNKTFFNNLSKLLRNLKGEFIQDYTSWLDKELEWFNSEIHDYFVDLQTYLYHLFEWLADQMNFEVNLETDPYDDTSLLNWLRRIYNKLGADGGPVTRPVDPSTDPEGFLDWLRRMIAEFILGLGASASDFVSDLGDLLSRLFAKFPFSVPWDLLGILGLLDAAPVAPRANFTIPLTIGNHEFNWTVDINLASWSTYMESVRTIILVSFISWLAWLTPKVLRDLDPGDFI